MKSVLFALGLLVSSQALANFDGCYQLVARGVMYPAVCLQGTIEEGINGSGVRLAVFGPNSNVLQQCEISTSSFMSKDEYRFQVNGKDELVLKNLKFEQGTWLYDAVVGNTAIKALKLSGPSADRLAALASKQCR